MAPKKVNLQWIANDSTRRATLKKRCNALMKKVSDMSTLCGIKASVVVYAEDEAKPEVYPSVPEARRLLNSFKAMPDYLENLKKVLNQEEYLRSRISKLQDQMCKSYHEKREGEALHLLHAAMVGHGPGLAGLTTEKLVSLNRLVERKIRNAEERFEQLIGQGPIQEPLLPPQEQPTLSSQLQEPYTYTEMPTLAPVDEPRLQQQDWLPADLAWNGEELDPVVYRDLGIGNDGAGPSASRGDTMQHYNMEVSGFPWSPDPIPDMEYGGCFDYSHACMSSYDA